MVLFNEVADFKSITDENQIIAHLIRTEFSALMPEPILDIGSGIGDITTKALAEKKVVLTDINPIKNINLPIAHSFLQANFFDLNHKVTPEHERPKTLMMSHVLQYIDDDLASLANQIRNLAPEKILLVTNDNTREMKDIIFFFMKNIIVNDFNPEYPDTDFLESEYFVEKTSNFQSTVSCNSFHDLAVQISYLMDCHLDTQNLKKLAVYLTSILKHPILKIDQSIRLFQRRIDLFL